jgi:subtilisin family serine protease
VPGVISASANIISRLQQEPDTVGVGVPNRNPIEQYAFAKLRMPQAHALAQGERVLIAIIDGGVDTSHPELAGVVVETFDAIGSGEQIHPHGTAVAGAIAAQVRIKGTAPAAQILAARAFGDDRTSAEGTGYNIAKAINWAVSRNARIINLSFAGDRDPKVEVALRAAHERGIILVAAAGNDGPASSPRFPAADANVIAVTATDQTDQLFSAAVRGKHIAVAAPGVDLMLPGLDGTYRQISGTSFSAAEVSGTVALMLERQPNLDPDTVRRTLMSTARDLGPRGIDPMYGAGLVDAYKALTAVTSQAVSSNIRHINKLR